MRGRRGGAGDRRVGLAVGQRQHHARQRDAVGDAVVDPEEHGAALAIALDQVHVPERARGVERRGDQVADELLEGGLVTRGGKSQPVHVLLDVELRVVLEARGPPERVAHAPPEAGEPVDDPAREDLPGALPVERLVEPDD